MRIMGIDPGSQTTGYGIIEDTPSLQLVSYGAITPPKKMSLAHRLNYIFDGLCKAIQLHNPKEIAIENVFFAKNAKSALILGQARGVAILAAARSSRDISEYSPTKIKQSLVGFGRADKSQVAYMVGVLLKTPKIISPLDATDALAVAICHAHMSGSSMSSLKTR